MSYLNFLLKSSNQHGVHSPFVYDLVTKCFYKKKKEAVNALNYPKPFRKKHLETLNDFIVYAKIKSALFYCKDNHFVKQLPNIKKQESNLREKVDLGYVAKEYFNKKTLNSVLTKLHSNSTLIIELPNKNKQLWEELKQQSISQVIIDTYFFGFIFTKNTQAKEEFRIRL